MSRCADDVLTVTAQLDQMVALLQLELSSGNNNAETRILDTILSGMMIMMMMIIPGHHPLRQ